MSRLKHVRQCDHNQSITAGLCALRGEAWTAKVHMKDEEEVHKCTPACRPPKQMYAHGSGPAQSAPVLCAG